MWVVYYVLFGHQIMPGSNSNLFAFAKSLSRMLYSMFDNMTLVKCVGFFAVGVILSYGLDFSCSLTTFIVALTYLATGGWSFVWIVINTLPRDIK
jgi:hypothetical protein